MKNSKTFSVITVTYNCKNTLEKTIQSVMNQAIDDLEYIIIDGGSTDGTIDILKQHDDDLSFWMSEKDGGIYDAMNKGISFASGEYIAFINSDDWYEPMALSTVLKYIENKDYPPLLYGKVNKIDNGKIVGYIGISEEKDPEELFYGNLYCHQGLFIKKSLFDEIGLYNIKYKILADFDWNLRAHVLGYDPVFIDYTVANFSVGGVSTIYDASKEFINITSSLTYNHLFKTEMLRERKGCNECRYLIKNHIHVYKDYFDCNKQYFIWGTGNWGEKIFAVINYFNLDFQGFIESVPTTDSKFGYKINKPFHVVNFQNNQMCIIVAVMDYETEIRNSLEQFGINADYCIFLSDIFKWSLCFYRKGKLENDLTEV